VVKLFLKNSFNLPIFHKSISFKFAVKINNLLLFLSTDTEDASETEEPTHKIQEEPVEIKEQ